MKSGYKIFWTDHALSELQLHLAYIENNWTKMEIKNFAHQLDHVIELISHNPSLFQATKQNKNVRRAVIHKHFTLYYQTKKRRIEILALFGNRQNPRKRKL
ncbi:type II toxin-antitoxin system RelE/ParE family toxin [Mangrovibacterium marinum]|uniref:Plasmid stabilization system protein ParE n=1 Tax=Mangrovibacterium marinum TaxID=1639118 RepID=A0A2T5C2K8_9BACT|nr:plasmid stabilization system protein ParE [Mangrovibacterium marinum]